MIKRRDSAFKKSRSFPILSGKTAILLILCISLVLAMLPLSVSAADGKSYKIVSPVLNSAGVAYYDNLLISVRIEPGQTLRFTVYNYSNYDNESSVDELSAYAFTSKTQTGTSDYYSARDSLSYYSKILNNVTPGLYELYVETLDSRGNPQETLSKYFIVKPGSERKAVKLYNSKPSGRVLFFQSVFRSIFGTVQNNE